MSWLYYHTQKTGHVSTLKSSKAVDNPISILISRLSGNSESIPKLKTGWEAWGKASYESLKRAFDDQFKSVGISDKGHAAAINKFKKERFLELSKEEQEDWTQKAITDHENAKAELKNRQGLSSLLSLQETQTCVVLTWIIAL